MDIFYKTNLESGRAGFQVLAPPARLELTTLRLGGVRSIQVSYGGIFVKWTRLFYPISVILSRLKGNFDFEVYFQISSLQDLQFRL